MGGKPDDLGATLSLASARAMHVSNVIFKCNDQKGIVIVEVIEDIFIGWVSNPPANTLFKDFKPEWQVAGSYVDSLLFCLL